MAKGKKDEMTGAEATETLQIPQEVQDIESLSQKNDISESILEGVKAMKDWPGGKAVTEEEFLKAVSDFLGSPIGA
ncbi:MAG: hypothetical protein Q4A78_07400 [Peptostreptococcaceae bacterium]|nr:hypothetical protein [Peptostreptococcaceae bacterium]